MKKSILFATFCLLLAGLFAQTGLFELSFGQDMADAHKALLAKGFKEIARTAEAITYTNAKIPELTTLVVNGLDNEGKIDRWDAKYNVTDKTEFTAKLRQELTAINKTEPYYDDFFGEWVWELDNDNAAYLSLAGGDSVLSVEYTDFLYYDESDYWW